MEIALWQVIILSLYAGVAIVIDLSYNIGMNGIIQTGVFTGLIMGRPEIGLMVGGIFQSYALGIGTYGGSSIPNWTSSAMVVTAFGATLGDAETLIPLVGVPLAALGVQFDVLGRMSNTMFQQRADKYIEVGNLEGIARMNLMGSIPWFLSRFIPMVIALSLGGAAIQEMMKFIDGTIPWITQGFQLAGKILPGVGFAILLKYLPIKRHFTWIIVGFVLSAYLNVPILGVSLIGLAAALSVYKTNIAGLNASVTVTETVDMGGDDEYDE